MGEHTEIRNKEIRNLEKACSQTLRDAVDSIQVTLDRIDAIRAHEAIDKRIRESQAKPAPRPAPPTMPLPMGDFEPGEVDLVLERIEKLEKEVQNRSYKGDATNLRRLLAWTMKRVGGLEEGDGEVRERLDGLERDGTTDRLDVEARLEKLEKGASNGR